MKSKELNDYHLRRWSLLVRLRDNFTCHVCGKRCKDESQAHHIYLKSLYPEKAYDLANGITVCDDHHQPLVHAQNSSWRKWTDFFKRPNRRKLKVAFNKLNQHKVQRKNSRSS